MPLLPPPGSRRRKKWITRYAIAGVLLFGSALCWLLYPTLKRGYLDHKKDRALGQARDFLVAEDFDRAKLALDVALGAKPGDPETLRVAVDLLEQVGSPEALRLQRALVRIAPQDTAEHAHLVTSALRFKDLNTARDGMRGMTPTQANEPVALRAALAYAQATHNHPIADLLYQQLRAEEPDNENLQVLHAVLLLQHPQADKRETALTELDRLRSQPRHQLFILRRLLIDAMSRRDTDRAIALAEELCQADGATLSDHLHRANLALNVARSPFPEVIAEVLPALGDDPAEVAELLRWLILVGQADYADSWLAEQSAELRADSALRDAETELAAARQDWDHMQDLLEHGSWGPVARDTVRLAFTAHLAASRNNLPLQDESWDEALVAGANRLADLTLLYRLAAIWRWEEHAEAPLWAITRAFPQHAWAHQVLFDYFLVRRDTRNMQALIGTLRLADPAVSRYQYDWALLTLLLRQSATWTDEKQTMESLYQRDPANAYYTTGYAFALALSERADEAVEAADTISAIERNIPERAPYLAYVYASAFKVDAVNELLAIAAEYPDYLPEELALLKQARDLVN